MMKTKSPSTRGITLILTEDALLVVVVDFLVVLVVVVTNVVLVVDAVLGFGVAVVVVDDAIETGIVV